MSKEKSDFNKELSKKLNARFSGIDIKDQGDGIMEISFGKDKIASNNKLKKLEEKGETND